METLDWVKLAGAVVQDSGKIPYEPNRHLFTKVAFDVFQLNTSPIESLWKLENDADGKSFLVAMYDEETDAKLTTKSSWNALSDKGGKNITLFYKDMPLQRFASTDYGFDTTDIHLFQKTLVEKLSSDKEFRQKFIDAQTDETKAQLFKKFPELV